MEMKLFQYREKKATKKKKKKSKYERWCLSRGGSSHDGSYGFGLWNSRTSNQLDKSSLLSIPW